MASPPRRMTRARAKKEGFEPDWRINPHWKTPKRTRTKAKTTVFNGLEETAKSVPLDAGLHSQRALSPVKIRIPAKLPPPHPGTENAASAESETAKQSSAIESSCRPSTLGSPVRVRPRTEALYKDNSDKENSPSTALLIGRNTPAKPTLPKPSRQKTHSRPLEASPLNINTHPQTPAVKVLSTPIRAINPQTPSRPLGSARRIPIRIEQTKTPSYKLNPKSNHSCPDSHRNFSYRVNHRPPSPAKLATGNACKVSSLTSHKQISGETEENLIRKLDVLQLSDAKEPSITSRQSFSYTIHLGKDLGLEHRSVEIPKLAHPCENSSNKTLQQPASLHLDKSPRVPTTNKTAHPVSLSRIPRSVSKSSSPTKNNIPMAHITPIRPPSPLVRKVCFRTPSMESSSKEANRVINEQKSFSILTLATPRLPKTPDISTTPNDSPASPSSPKVFNLSDAGDSSFELFTPRKPKITPRDRTTTTTEDEFNHNPTERNEQQPSSSRNTCLELLSRKEIAVAPVEEAANRPVMSSPTNDQPSQDIRVPIKDDNLDAPLTQHQLVSAATSGKPGRGDKDSKEPLRGVVAFVDVRTADGDDAGTPFAETLKHLGAKVVKQWTWNGEELDKVGITHVIFKQGGPRTLSKVKAAKGAVKCVGLGWISRCNLDQRRVDEALFQVEIPSGHYGHRRRKSMEPRALMPTNTTPLKEHTDKDVSELERAQRILAELSLNKDPDIMTPLQSLSLQLARRKSIQHAPCVSSPLARGSWTIDPAESCD